MKWCLWIVLILIHTSLYASQSGDFKLVKQDNQISLYERWIPGGDGETVREIKATFQVRSDVKSVARLLTNQQKGTDWNANAKAYHVVTTTDENAWIIYMKYAIPWPFGDQDCCLLYHLSKRPDNERAGEITFESTQHNKFPVAGNVSRITGTRGKWLMEEQGNGNMKITYTISTNRSKKVPRWVSDPIIRNNLFETMTTFRNLLEKHNI